MALANFTNTSGYSSLSKKNYRRHFLKAFNFPKFNQSFLKQAWNPTFRNSFRVN